MKKHIPNFITCLNIICGGLAIYLLTFYPFYSLLLFGLCLIFDFCDGLVARILDVQSEMGKQLDSLADLISFGFFPAGILAYFLFVEFETLRFTNFHLFILTLTISLLLLVFSALRLAKFNIAPQSNNFIGLPTPANALFWVGLLCVHLFDQALFESIPHKRWIAIGLVPLSCFLLISNINLFSFKFSHFKWQGNQMRYVFIILAVILFVWLKFAALAPIIVVYIIWSIISNKIWKWSLSQK